VGFWMVNSYAKAGIFSKHKEAKNKKDVAIRS
jgi:hypothetical protein